jgi:hypothetical protein
MSRWGNALFWVVHIAAPMSIGGVLTVLLLVLAISLGAN